MKAYLLTEFTKAKTKTMFFLRKYSCRRMSRRRKRRRRMKRKRRRDRTHRQSDRNRPTNKLRIRFPNIYNQPLVLEIYEATFGLRTHVRRNSTCPYSLYTYVMYNLSLSHFPMILFRFLTDGRTNERRSTIVVSLHCFLRSTT